MNYQELGLTVSLNFISIEEENEIMSCIDRGRPVRINVRNSIKRYGSKDPYKDNFVSEKIPEFIEKIGDKLLKENKVSSKPMSITLNEYFKDQMINAHIDSPASGKIITILSLLSDAIMEFSKEKEKFEVSVPARSLVQMSDEIREKWMHSVKPVSSNRYSIVFRCSD